jgi:hypothetical protein
MARIVAIVGKSDVGKTTVRRELERRLRWSSITVDHHRTLGAGWTSLLIQVETVTWPVLVETIAFPPGYRDRLAQHDTRLLEVVCDEEERLRRGGLENDHAYDYQWPGKRILRSDEPIDYDELAAWCREGRR